MRDTAIEARRRLPWYRRLAFGTGHVLHVLAVAMWIPYDVTFYQKVIGLSASSTGVIVLVGQIVGAVALPFVGMWSDQVHCRFYGKRKVFHLIGVLAGAASFFFIWHTCLGCDDAPAGYQVLYFACFAAVFQFSWSAVQIAQLSLIPELTTDKDIKVELNSIRFAFSMASFLVVFGCLWVLLANFNKGGDASGVTRDDAPIFWIMALVVIILGFCITMIFQIFIREDPNAELPKQKWYRWPLQPQFYLTACAFVASRIIVFLPQTYLPLYFLDTLKMDTTSIAKGPLLLLLSSLITTFTVKRFSRFVGLKMMYFLGMAFVWGAAIWFWVQDPTNDSTSHFNLKRDSIYGATILLGMGGAMACVIGFSMITLLVGKYSGSSAIVYGWMLFGDRFFNGVLVQIIQEATPDSDSSKEDFYRNVMIIGPFAATALGLVTIVLWQCYDWMKQKPITELCRENEVVDQLIQQNEPDVDADADFDDSSIP